MAGPYTAQLRNRKHFFGADGNGAIALPIHQPKLYPHHLSQKPESGAWSKFDYYVLAAFIVLSMITRLYRISVPPAYVSTIHFVNYYYEWSQFILDYSLLTQLPIQRFFHIHRLFATELCSMNSIFLNLWIAF